MSVKGLLRTSMGTRLFVVSVMQDLVKDLCLVRKQSAFMCSTRVMDDYQSMESVTDSHQKII